VSVKPKAKIRQISLFLLPEEIHQTRNRRILWSGITVFRKVVHGVPLISENQNGCSTTSSSVEFSGSNFVQGSPKIPANSLQCNELGGKAAKR
jgi:hypothetical protein